MGLCLAGCGEDGCDLYDSTVGGEGKGRGRLLGRVHSFSFLFSYRNMIVYVSQPIVHRISRVFWGVRSSRKK